MMQDQKDWPIWQLHTDKKELLEEFIESSVERLNNIANEPEALKEVIVKTAYQEQIRINKKRWKVDPADEDVFWKGIQDELSNLKPNNPEQDNLKLQNLLKQIIKRYAKEIISDFKKKSHAKARFWSSYAFSRLLHVYKPGRITSLLMQKDYLKDKLIITGEHAKLKALAEKGTIVLVPTHYSHLDNILIGLVIDMIGLPPFLYGAGLNLFNSNIFSYMFKNLGVYKIDRRKKNLIYLATLKNYSSLVLQKGCHSIFYPAGTRSRSGAVANHLKLGLLNSTIDAQRSNYAREGEGANKIFVVPVVFNYHFVLETPTLIKEYLMNMDQEGYYTEHDQYPAPYKVLNFLYNLFTRDSSITIAFANPMDVLGNCVDEKGNSYDQRGNLINTYDYFLTQHQVTQTEQREEQYIKMLSKAIIKQYDQFNCVFASTLGAFVGFQLMQRKHSTLSFSELFKLSSLDLQIPLETFEESYVKMRKQILTLYKQGQIQVSKELMEEAKTKEIMLKGISDLGIYHAQKPLLKDRKDRITTQNLSILYYYHNRLAGYDLEQYIT